MIDVLICIILIIWLILIYIYIIIMNALASHYSNVSEFEFILKM